jgi:hypothetical protein
VLDKFAADFGEEKTYDEWLFYWRDSSNNADGKRWFPSLPDFYRWAKQAKEEPDRYRSVLNSLKNDFNDSGLMLSTKIYYYNDYKAMIVHHCGLEGHQEFRVEIPKYHTRIGEVLSTVEGRKVLSILFGTNDSDKEIIEVWKNVCGRDPYHITVTSPNKMEPFNGRQARNSRNVLLTDSGNGHFLISLSHSKAAYSRCMSYL